MAKKNRRLVVRVFFNIIDHHGRARPAIAAVGFGIYQLQNNKFLIAVPTDELGFLQAIHPTQKVAGGRLVFAAFAGSGHDSDYVHAGSIMRLRATGKLTNMTRARGVVLPDNCAYWQYGIKSGRER